ncbi:hypothetical protein [Nitrospira sp. BLG_1]|uniref:hypothetical protein n=1 Tax=Nitrospira sp. BLG_1 TaxID=3395883 RepID=UPI0039BD6C67
MRICLRKLELQFYEYHTTIKAKNSRSRALSHPLGVERCSVRWLVMQTRRTNQEIAHRLKIPLGKLSTRLRALYKRLNISRRAEVAKYYVEWRKENHQTGDDF